MKKNSGLLIALLLFMFFSCEKNDADDPLTLPQHAITEVEKRIEQFKKEKRQQCIDEVVRVANQQLDSTLLSMKVLIPIDVQGTIPKPQRPVRPDVREKTDTTPVKPFLNYPPKDS